MAQTENGVGVSYKLSDGTMVWTRRDTWAEVLEDVGLIFGAESAERLTEALGGAWVGATPRAVVYPKPVAVVAEPTPEAVASALGATAGETTVAFETCRVCGALKDRWVPPGISAKSGKAYPGFYGCSTPRCPGK